MSRAPPSRMQLLICAFLAGVLITAVLARHLYAHGVSCVS